jgi:hypothetical protein
VKKRKQFRKKLLDNTKTIYSWSPAGTCDADMNTEDGSEREIEPSLVFDDDDIFGNYCAPALIITTHRI